MALDFEALIDEKTQMVNFPTIKKMIEALSKMQDAGVDPDALINISHIVNTTGAFWIQEHK